MRRVFKKKIIGYTIVGALTVGLATATIPVFAKESNEGASENSEMDEGKVRTFKDIRSQLKDGTLTPEEAQAQMEELGLEFRGKYHGGSTSLTDESNATDL